MKTANEVTRMVRGSTLALASILVAVLAATGSASAEYKPTSDDSITASPKVHAQLNTQRAGATTVSAPAATMACSKCQDGFVTVTDTTGRGLGARTLTGRTTKLVAKHQCESCGADWRVAGTGKARQAVASHKCLAGVAEDPACCSGQESGAVATKGMGQKVGSAPLK